MALPCPPLPKLLPNGRYIIKNDVNNDSVGNRGPNPPVQPVVRVNRPEVWFVRHVKDFYYLLYLRRFVALPHGDHVETDRTGVLPTKWIIKEYENGRYTIIDPQSRAEHKGWTLYPGPGNPEVVLKPVPCKSKDVKPPQLWRFQHILGQSEEDGEREGDEELEEEEELEEN